MKCRAMTKIMQVFLCVVVVVSAFFYAPMEVSASENSFVSTSSSQFWNNHSIAQLWSSKSGDLVSGLDFDSYYEIDFTLTGSVIYSESVYMRCSCINYGDLVLYYGPQGLNSENRLTYHTLNYSGSLVAKGSDLVGGSFRITSDLLIDTITSTPYIINESWDFNFIADSIKLLMSTESDEYQNGYNVGYSAGESAGYGNGYSNGFADGEASVDTGAIYDEAFQAGKDSVDTQSYYDAGYQAGYQVAYSEGYESGYDEGYQSAMDRIANWGADTSAYPILLFDESVSQPSVYVDCMSNIPGTSYGATSLFHLDFNVNPNHTYKFVFDSEGFYSDTYNCLFGDRDLGYVVGNLRIPASYNTSWGTNTVFIPGDCFSSVVKLDAYVYEMRYYGGVNESDDLNLALGQVRFGTHGDVSLKVYDMGPSGDTQNHIANQTDQLTNGYDSSQGAAMNDDFKASVNDYQTAEDSLFTSAQTSLDNFTFLDFTSITGMVTALSFVSSIMTRIYNAMGGDTGASGIVLSVLFSIMLVSMAIGLYRFYVSNGKSDSSNKGGD